VVVGRRQKSIAAVAGNNLDAVEFIG